MAQAPTGLVYVQPVSRGTSLLMKVKEILYRGKTAYQDVEIVIFEEYGLSLILDGLVQSAEADEAFYHEALVHPAMITHGSPERVLIIGGGEGYTLREVLRYRSVARAVMVDIDGELVELAKKYLSRISGGSLEDPRAEVVIMDGLEYVDKASGPFDVVILDLTDPYGPEVGRKLYTAEFYKKISRILGHRGVVTTQAGCAFYYKEHYDEIYRSMASIFPVARSYSTWIPSFGYAVSFVIASRSGDPAALKSEEVEMRLQDLGVRGLRYYSGKTHEGLFSTPIALPSW